MDDLQALVNDIHREIATRTERGRVADYIPPLAEVDPQCFGIAITTVDGQEFVAGDADTAFSIQSVSKVFTLTLALGMVGDRLWSRVGREPVQKRTVISSWTALLAYVRVALAHEPREQFRVLFLDKKNQLIADETMNEGTVDHAPVYPREVMRRALELSASSLILVHNHPSGDPTPSQPDIDMTRQVIEAGRTLRITVHDHLVVGRDGVASFKALGLI